MNVLLSIKPRYTKKIFSGEKKYEFRKQKPKEIPEKVIIYECHPSKNIVGWFIVKRIISGPPKEIWVKCKNSSGMKEEDYFNYCYGSKIIYAFEIDRTFQFDTAINPFEIDPDFNPPQNFSYLNHPLLSNLIESMGSDGIC